MGLVMLPVNALLGGGDGDELSGMGMGMGMVGSTSEKILPNINSGGNGGGGRPRTGGSDF